MGKSRSRRYKPLGYSPTVAKQQQPVDGGDEAEGESLQAEDLLQKLQSPCPEVREFACASISKLVQQKQVIPQFLQRDAVRCLGPLLLDKCMAVRETAAGALRNLSTCGGFEACDDMVTRDIMTPLVALLRECSTGFDSNLEPLMNGKEQPKNYVEDIANQAVNVLWNVCESNSQALTIFNKENCVDIVIQCLNKFSTNTELAISAAYCLQTVTEDNSDLLASLDAASLQTLESVLADSTATMDMHLLKTLVAGTVWNLKERIPACSQADSINAILRILSEVLSLDAGQFIVKMKETEAMRLKAAELQGEAEVAAAHLEEATLNDEDGMEAGGGKRLKHADFFDLMPASNEELKQASYLLVAQKSSLEILVNMCCSDDLYNWRLEGGAKTLSNSGDQVFNLRGRDTRSHMYAARSLEKLPEPSDDEWEELSSSDESDICLEKSVADGQLLSPLCLSAEVHSGLLNHFIPKKVFEKTCFPDEKALLICTKCAEWKPLRTKMYTVQHRALTCLNNILSVLDMESLGGISALQELSQHLSQLVLTQSGKPCATKEFIEGLLTENCTNDNKPDIPKRDDFLEAAGSALRALLEMMASKGIPQCMTPEQVMSFGEVCFSSTNGSARVNAVGIIGITGSVLAKSGNTAETLKLIGNFLLEVASNDTSLVVSGGALDAIFDVFADGDEAEKAAVEMKLLQGLKKIQPAFKSKLRKEGRDKYSTDQLCVLDNVRTNLRRFISYLETVERKALKAK